jgi:aminoglycoside phosphotransferase family enzyme/predicted kinase
VGNEEQQQAEVLRLLRGRDPSRPVGDGAAAAEVETHAARVFLSGDRAFKMKRAVRYSFLDFSTLAARRAALEAELRLNRRTAPMLYRRLIPVTRTEAGGVEIDGEGDAVEWLLEMTRFDETDRLDRIAAHGPLPGSVVAMLAETVADLHGQVEIRSDMGGAAAMTEIVEGNAGDLAELVPDIFRHETVQRLDDLTRRELDRRRIFLDRRRLDGFVRHCHGDLHLANVVLLDGRPILFDCLEFDPALATIDVLYDLAFLIMDLLHREQRAAAVQLLALYLERTEDDAGAALLPLFLAIRAAIRGKIAGFEALEHDARGDDARAHLELATRFLEDRPRPQLIAIGGLSGTGKSTLARTLAPDLGPVPGAVTVRSDGTRKRLFGRHPEERLGPEAYREEVSDRVFARMAERARSLLEAGHAVIADGVFLRPGQRTRIERAAGAAGVPFHGLWLEAPDDVAVHRVEGRRGGASDATAAVVQMQRAADPGPLDWVRIRAEGDPGEIAAAARRIIHLAG